MASLDTASTAQDQTVSSGVGDDGRPRALWNQPKIGLHGYLTPQAEWGDVERGNPLPYTLPPERRREVGLDRETWRLEVIPDPAMGRALVHWAAELAELTPGAYDVRCRSIDLNGVGQPMPRPFAKGGRADIQTLPLTIKT